MMSGNVQVLPLVSLISLLTIKHFDVPFMPQL